MVLEESRVQNCDRLLPLQLLYEFLPELSRFLTGVVIGASVYARTPGGSEAVPPLLMGAKRALRAPGSN